MKRIRFTLTGTRGPVASFHVDQELVAALKEGDRLHIATAIQGGIGISFVRDRTLLAAAGAISAVPLSPDVTARIPFDLAQASLAAYRKHDVTFQGPAQIPVEITVAGTVRLSLGGRFDLGPYHVFVEHPYYDLTDGIDECVALSLRGTISDFSAIGSAQLIAFGGAH